MLLRNVLRVFWIIVLTSVVSSLVLSHVGFASQVQVCKKIKQSKTVNNSKQAGKKVFCTIRPATGRVGDFVEIKDQHNYIVATGRIIKRGRTTSKMILTGYKKDLGSMAGYPVLLKDNDNQDFWTATTAPF